MPTPTPNNSAGHVGVPLAGTLGAPTPNNSAGHVGVPLAGTLGAPTPNNSAENVGVPLASTLGAPASNNGETVGQVVDTPSALEFMREALEKITEDELVAIVAELRSKSQGFRQMLAPKTLPAFDESKFRALLRSIFSTRRRAAEIMALVNVGVFRDAASELLHGTAPLVERFDTFVARLEPLNLSTRCDLAGECLHYWDSERYWLWTRWMWDPERNTGSLPLVTIQEYDLHGETPGSTYVKVGEAIAFVNGVGEAAGFQHGGRGLLGTDVYLACVYVVYLYTVTRMRMTREFNKVIPQFPELIRRLLGTYKMEV